MSCQQTDRLMQLIGLLYVYNSERLNELSQELDNLYSLYAGKKVKTRCRDLYNVHKRVIKIDIFRFNYCLH